MSTRSQEFNAVHESKDEYKYRIGVCVDVDETYPDCAVMQYEVAGDKRARCAGKVNTAQIARSKATIFNDNGYVCSYYVD